MADENIQSPERMLTLGEISVQLGLPLYRVQYAVTSRGIKPAFKLGNVNAYDQAGYNRIKSECERIARGSRGCS